MSHMGMGFELLILTQGDAVIVGAGFRQPRGKVFVEEPFLQQIVRDILFGQMIPKATQADNVFTYRAVTHFSLLK
ncbi:Uncharacterised protein [Citrobacter portucalensis]|nr:Uncharacterised protein [Citrobacter portucalensis]